MSKKIEKQDKEMEKLKLIGIETRSDILLNVPVKYHDYRVINKKLPTIKNIPEGRYCYEVIVSKYFEDVVALEAKPPRIKFEVTDGENYAVLTIFGNTWPWLKTRPGHIICIEGELSEWNGELNFKNVKIVSEDHKGRIIPQYRAKTSQNKLKAVSSDFIYKATVNALEEKTISEATSFICSVLEELSIKSVFDKVNSDFKSPEQFFNCLHLPKKIEDKDRALKTVKAISAYELVFNAIKSSSRVNDPLSVVELKNEDIRTLIHKFPYKLTDHQLSGIADIVNDLKSEKPMYRLLSGDVGYGKTEVALIPAIASQKQGKIVAIMCPSLLIVSQWVKKIKGYGEDIPYLVITGENETTSESFNGNPIVIGTSAIVHRFKKMKIKPDFIIFDEQHKHGKKQRESLVFSHTNTLEATATCQPKTSALVNYGIMNETILNQCPVDKNIQTYLFKTKQRVELFKQINQLIQSEENIQVAIIYPKVDSGSEKDNLLVSAKLWESRYPGQVGIIYGGMSDSEKLEIIDKMHSNQIKILCSSILIETGLTLPSLKGMLVVGAQYFGVSSLHQLRGRLARNGGDGFFYMYLSKEEESHDQEDEKDNSLERLELLVKFNDGFILAEKDAQLRGYGNIEDDDQSGKTVSRIFKRIKLMPSEIKEILSLR